MQLLLLLDGKVQQLRLKFDGGLVEPFSDGDAVLQGRFLNLCQAVLVLLFGQFAVQICLLRLVLKFLVVFIRFLDGILIRFVRGVLPIRCQLAAKVRCDAT